MNERRRGLFARWRKGDNASGMLSLQLQSLEESNKQGALLYPHIAENTSVPDPEVPPISVDRQRGEEVAIKESNKGAFHKEVRGLTLPYVGALADIALMVHDDRHGDDKIGKEGKSYSEVSAFRSVETGELHNPFMISYEARKIGENVLIIPTQYDQLVVPYGQYIVEEGKQGRARKFFGRDLEMSNSKNPLVQIKLVDNPEGGQEIASIGFSFESKSLSTIVTSLESQENADIHERMGDFLGNKMLFEEVEVPSDIRKVEARLVFNEVRSMVETDTPELWVNTQSKKSHRLKKGFFDGVRNEFIKPDGYREQVASPEATLLLLTDMLKLIPISDLNQKK